MSLMKTNILVRSLSTSAAACRLVKAPLQVFGMEGRYASALYSAASKQKALDAVEKELTSFLKHVKADPKLKEFLINPSMKRMLKVDAFKHLSSKIFVNFVIPRKPGCLSDFPQDGILCSLETHYIAVAVTGDSQQLDAMNLSPTTGNLLGLMAENGRLGNLEAVINAFKLIMAAHRGEVACEVITAKPLDSAQRQSLEAALKKFMKSNQSLQLTAKVDPSLIGGMIVSIDDRYVDMSVASKVKKYTEIISASA